STMNSGVCVRGSDSSSDFYGQLQDVVQLEYLGGGERKVVVLFYCLWYDPINGMNVHSTYKIVDVHQNRLYKKFDPFVLAQQAIQVYYSKYPSLEKDKIDWMAVCETKSRR
ncbi:hypothetical protein CCACVL1_07518, partial [Corchorus capsularis]